jgi:hypothetical protein
VVVLSVQFKKTPASHTYKLATSWVWPKRLVTNFLASFLMRHVSLRNFAFQTVLLQTAASAEAFLRAIVALLIKGFAQKPTLRTKPNVT